MPRDLGRHRRARLRGNIVRAGGLAWALTALLVVDLGATAHAAPLSTLQSYGALQREGTPGVVSHRGAAAVAPENTIASIRVAIAQQVDFVEFDVQLTKDGAAVLMHDPTLDRTTNGTGRVSAHTLAEIRALDAGAWFGESFVGEPVPTFVEATELLRLAPTRALIEFKEEWSEAELDTVVATLREAQLLNRVVLQSFNLATLEAMQRVAPEFARMLLTRDLGDDIIALALRLEVSGIGAKGALYAAVPGAIEQIRREGIGAAAYTLNSSQEWQFAIESGLDLVITDDPVALSEWHLASASGAQSTRQ